MRCTGIAFQKSGRVSDDHVAGRDILNHDGAGADDGIFTDRHSVANNRSNSDPRAPANSHSSAEMCSGSNMNGVFDHTVMIDR